METLNEMKRLEALWIQYGTDLPKYYLERLNASEIAFINELQDYYG